MSALVEAALWRRVVPVTVKLAGSGILLTVLAMAIDWRAAWAAMSDLPPAVLLLALAALTAQALTAAWRWRWLNRVAGLSLSFAETTRALYVGLLFNQMLPSAIGGDAARVVQLTRYEVGWGQAIASVLGDRLLGLLALVATAAIGIPALLEASVAPPLTAAVAVLAIGAWTAILWLIATRGRLPFAQYLPTRLQPIQTSLLALFQDRPKAVGLLAASMAVHGWTVVAMVALAWGLGLAVPPLALAAILPPILLLSTLPLSVAGWGVRETLMIGALAGFGVAPAMAVALSVTFGLTLAVASVPGLLLWRW